MDTQVWVSIVAAVIAAVGAFIAWWQGWNAKKSADAATVEAAKATAAAERVAAAQERLAELAETERVEASSAQARQVRIEHSLHSSERGRVRVENASADPIFEVRLARVSVLVDGVEQSVDWRPNPYMSGDPGVRRKIDGRSSGELYPFFDGGLPEGAPWSVIVRFQDARGVVWEINPANEIEPVEG